MCHLYLPLLILTFFFRLVLSAQPLGFAYVKRIAIQGSKLSGSNPLQNFTVLISFTDPDLRTTAYGGHVSSANGYDLMFTTDVNCSIALPFQVERYTPGSGELIAWVKMPNLVPGSNTTILLFYGNPAISTSPFSNNVWTASVQGRYHMNQDPSMGSLIDFSGNANHSFSYEGTMNSNSLVNGKIGQALSFNGSQGILLGNTIVLLNNYTLSVWIKSNQPDANTHGIMGSNQVATSSRSPGLWIYNRTGFSFGLNINLSGTRYWCSGTTATGLISNGTTSNWHYISYVYNGADQSLYVDGVPKVKNTSFCNGYSNATLQALNSIGRCENYFTGCLDEVSISSIAQTPDWIATEYTNQNDPASFIAVSAEQAAISLCSLLPVTLTAFSAMLDADQRSVRLAWNTASEPENAYFVLYKSAEAQHWTQLKTLQAKGNNHSGHAYTVVDERPGTGIHYYRLKQVNADSSFTWLGIVSEIIPSADAIQIYPVPTKERLTVLLPGSKADATELRLINALNVLVYHQELDAEVAEAQVDVQDLENGIYELEIRFAGGGKSFHQKIVIDH